MLTSKRNRLKSSTPQHLQGARPLPERLESRLMYAVTAALVGGQLQVTGDAAADVITLDHSPGITTVAGRSFADAAITNGILVRAGGGDDTFNLLATAKPVRFEGEGDHNAVIIGKAGSVRQVTGGVTIANNFLT